MKAVVVLALCVGLAFFCYNIWFSGELVRDQGTWIPVAFGVPSETTIQMHIAVAPGIAMRIPGKQDPRTLRIDWDEWVATHFQLLDASGNKVRLQRIGTSGLFTGEVAAGAPEFALWAEVKKGGAYTCDYIPDPKLETRYRYPFTVPEKEQKVAMKSFEPFKG